MKNRIIKILFFIILASNILYSQTEQDTTLNVQKDEQSFVMQKSPWGAVLRSAVLPGWGQFYNESYWKIPVVWGIMGAFVYGWVYYNDLYVEFRGKFNNSLIEIPNDGNPVFKNKRDFYRDERDLFTIYFGIAYFLNLVDAYVDAHLFDFDVSENPIIHSPQLKIKFFFNR